MPFRRVRRVRFEVSISSCRLFGLCLFLGTLSVGRGAEERSFEQRLVEGQQLRIGGHYREAEESLTALLREARRQKSDDVLLATVLDRLGNTEQDLANY